MAHSTTWERKETFPVSDLRASEAQGIQSIDTPVVIPFFPYTFPSSYSFPALITGSLNEFIFPIHERSVDRLRWPTSYIYSTSVTFGDIRMWHMDLFPHRSNLRLTSWEWEGAMEDKVEKNNAEFLIKMFFCGMKGNEFHPNNSH